MLARLFRLLDRLGGLVAKIAIWLGRHLDQSLHGVSLWVSERSEGYAILTDSARIESQVRLLSGLAVILLASVALLIFWATTPQALNSPATRLPPLAADNAAPEPAEVNGPPAQQTPASAGEFLDTGGTLIFSMYVGSQSDLFALTAGQDRLVRLTDSPADERDPAWSPDGQRVAFASRRDGNWEIYILNMVTGEISRVTYDLAYEASPSWSPDGQWIAYEAYYEGNLDVYIIRADGSEGPYPLTRQPGPDFSPAWTTATEPFGREIAYVSNRDGYQDIYLISLDDPSEERAVNLTRSLEIDEDEPAWGPNGTLLAYTTVENGIPLVHVIERTSEGWKTPLVVSQGHSPAWSPDGRSLVFLAERSMGGSLLLTSQLNTWQTSLRAFSVPSVASGPVWSIAPLPAIPRGTLAFAATAPLPSPFEEPLVIEPQQDGQAPYRLVDLRALGVIAESPFLSDRVDGSFTALREYVDQIAGWDFLGQLDEVYWDLRRRTEPGQDYHSWHKAGRAFDVVQTYAQGSPAQIELIPYQVGPDTYWRLYVRCAIQDGTLGEPLRHAPWDFTARFSGDVDAYEAGGRFKDSVPSGYYIDFTQAAQLFGWMPVSSDSSWRYNWPGILYWQYEKRDGLDWWNAMREIYPEDTLREVFGSMDSSPMLSPDNTPTPEDAIQAGQ